MGQLKFVESGTFRHVARPMDAGDTSVLVGRVVSLRGDYWRIVGAAPNPNRPDDLMVFVERTSLPSTAPAPAVKRRSLRRSTMPPAADDPMLD
jgi:hypothetical protein